MYEKVFSINRIFLRFIPWIFLLIHTGCAVSSKVTSTPRSSTEQRLLVRSLERAVSKLQLEKYRGKRVALELHALTGDRDFAKAWIATHLEEAGARIVDDSKKADIQLRVFASVLGVDHGETLVGLPSFEAPLVGLPFPEIALFKWVRNRGSTEVEIFAFDARSGEFVGKSSLGEGTSKYDEFTILVLVSFAWSDLERRGKPVDQ